MHHCCIHPVTYKCLTSECCNWSCRKYSWLETFFFLDVLVVLISISKFELAILATKINIGLLGPGIWPLSYQLKFSSYTKWENSLISGLSWPIFIIFVSNMVNSYLLIDIIMTRNVHEWKLGVKICNNHEKPMVESFAVIQNGKIALFQAPVDQFSWFLWLLWSIHMCWLILWWPETSMSGYWGWKHGLTMKNS